MDKKQKKAEKIQKKEEVVAALAKYRTDNLLTLKILSDELNLPLTTVSSWLNGENYPGEISIAILIKFLKEKGYFK